MAIDREEYEEAKFRVLYKYSSEGYDSPMDMLENEPGYREVLGDDFYCDYCTEYWIDQIFQQRVYS